MNDFMTVERFARCTNLACRRWVICAPGDPDGQCAVCTRAALEALRSTWLRDREIAAGELEEARGELERMTCERDDLVLELERLQLPPTLDVVG